MSRADIIRETMRNMEALYRDFGAMAQMIEQHMENSGFQALGDVNGTWETSTSYRKPRDWLCRSFARAYSRGPLMRKCVGFCMHFGAYSDVHVEALAALRVRLPAVSVLLLNLNADFKGPQPYLYRTLFRAGWKDVSEVCTERGTVIHSEVAKGKKRVGGKAVTYFADLLALDSREAIHRLVAGPMVRMYDGQEQCVADESLPVIRVAEGA